MKKLIKKSLSLLLCVFMLFGSAPLSGFKSINWSGAFEKIAGWLDNLKLSVSASAESTLAPTGQCGDNAYWRYDEDTETLIIFGEGEVFYFDSLGKYDPSIESYLSFAMYGASIKTLIIEEGITGVYREAFYCCTDLSNITLPDTITHIGYNAFSGTAYYSNKANWDNGSLYIGENLIRVDNSVSGIYTVRNGTKTIAGGAFSDRWKIEKIIIPDSVVGIGEHAFLNGEFTSITIPDSVVSIGYGAFEECRELDTIKLSNHLVNIADYTFLSCSKLNHVIIPDSVTSIGEGAFVYCKSLTDIKISNSITSIEKIAFGGCYSLTDIKIPNSVQTIHDNAFADCTNLISINIPENVNSIGLGIFNYCDNLMTITIDENNQTYDDRNNCNAIINTKTNTLICGCNNTVIPDSITAIADDAFESCGKLTNISIPNGVTYIGKSAFSSCTSLTSIELPDSLIRLGQYAFYGCSNLSQIIIPDTIIYFADNIFDGTKYYNNESNWEENALYIGKHLIDVDRGVSGSFKIKDGTLTIAGQTFEYCEKITEVFIPNSVESIGENAFYNINNIIYSENWYNDVMHRQGSPWGAKAVDAYIEGDLYYYDSSKELLLGCSAEATGTVTIPDTVEEVGENCFGGCNNITSINFSSPVYFADTAVSGCDNLQTVIAPDNTDSFGVVYTKPLNSGISTASSIYSDKISFEYDTGILLCNKSASGEYSVPSEITHICESAFANCRNVTVKIPEEVNLKSIGTKAFFNTANYNNPLNWINNVLIIDHYVIVSKNVFSGIFNLADNIKGIADKAFERCSSLTGFSFGTNSNLRFLGSRAFSGCSSEIKTSIHLPATLKYVGEDLFDSDSETTETLYIDSVLASVSPDVESFTIKDGTTKIAAGAFSGCTKLTEIVIPDAVRIIEKNTFKGCIGLKSVTLNENITEIGDSAFADCMSLEEINIPAGVKEIGHLAFYGCVGMKSYNVSNNNKNFKSVNGVLMSKDGRRIIQYPAAKTEINNTYTISDRTFVSDLAFYRCLNLKKIKIGDELEYGNRNPFASCTAGFCFGDEYQDYLFGDTDGTVLKSVSASVSGIFKIPESVTEIGSDAFRECTSITGIDFSEAEGIDVIGDYAFYNCTGLTKITIPNTVTKIGKSAFENCLNLQNVIFDNTVDLDENYNLVSIGNYAFCNCPCNTENGSCNYGVLKAENLSIGKNAFKNVFCDSVKLDSNGLIYGLKPGIENLKDFIGINDDDIVVSCIDKKIATGSTISVTNGNEKSNYYDVVIFGDVNGDGWYDGTDAMIVKCIAAGMLTRGQVGEAVYTSADCNHDGVIDSKDVELLEQAGVLLSEVDQSKSGKELIETSSAYNEYLALIDQNVENNSDESTEKSWLDILVQAVTRFINYIIRILSILNLR